MVNPGPGTGPQRRKVLMSSKRLTAVKLAVAPLLAAWLLAAYMLLGGLQTASATHADGVSISASSVGTSATDVTYTIEFTIGGGNGSTLAGQGDVEIEFPAGYDVSGAEFVEANSTLEAAAITGQYAQFAISGQSLRLLDFTPILSDGTTFVLEFDGIENPATAGAQSLNLRVWNDDPGGAINTNGLGFVTITGPELATFEVTATGGGAVADQTVGSAFQIEVAALDGSGDPFTGLTDSAFSVDISVVGDDTGASGLGTVSLDFSGTPGTATHTVTLTAEQTAEAITVASTADPTITGTSNAFNVVAAPEDEDDDEDVDEPEVIIEAGEVPVEVVNRRSVRLDPDAATTAETTAPNGATMRVEIPAAAVDEDTGSLRLEVAAVRDQAALNEDAPPLMDGAIVTSFTVRLLDEDGNAVDATFTEPVTLTFEIPADQVPEDTEGGDLLLAYWNGSEWVLVEATATVHDDGSVTIVTEVDHFTLFQVTTTPENWGHFVPVTRPGGVTFTVWYGSGYEALDAELGGGTAWILEPSGWIAYTPGAPAFVNAAFVEAYPAGIPWLTAVVVER